MGHISLVKIQGKQVAQASRVDAHVGDICPKQSAINWTPRYLLSIFLPGWDGFLHNEGIIRQEPQEER